MQLKQTDDITGELLLCLAKEVRHKESRKLCQKQQKKAKSFVL